MAGLIRSAHPKITYNGTDVSADWVPNLKHLTWKRGIGMNKRADTISLILADPEGKFRKTYNIIAKQSIQLQVESWNWNYPGEHLMSDSTQMQITRIEISLSKHTGSELHIEASSIPPTCGFRLTRKSRTAISTDLKTVAGQVAKDQGWTLDYRASVNPKVAYSCQHDQSDAAWLERFCHEQDLTYKPKNKVLMIYGNQDLEAQAPKGTIVCFTPISPGGINGRGLIHVRLYEDVEDTYAHSIVKSKDLKTGKITTGQADDPDPNGPVLNQVHRPTGVVTDPEPATDIPK
jgi:phage protein D